MDRILSPPPPPLAILTGVWSPSILSTDILSIHRVICPTTESPSMKYPYPRQPMPPPFWEILYLPLPYVEKLIGIAYRCLAVNSAESLLTCMNCMVSFAHNNNCYDIN